MSLVISPKKDSGFTLIETLVAIFLFSLLATGSTLALTQTLGAQAVLNEAQDELGEVMTARRIMADDFAKQSDRAAKDERGQLRPARFAIGTSPLAAFVRGERPNPNELLARPSERYIEYIFEDGQLWRESWPIHPGAQTEPHRRALISNLRSAKTHIIRNGAQGSAFISPRGDSQALPGLVQFTLEFENDQTLTLIFEVG